jgi:hypothetical protein
MKANYLCGPAQLSELANKAAVEGDSVLDHLRMIRTVLTGQLAAASEAGDGRLAAHISSKLVDTLQAIARITGELGELARSTINVTNNVAVLQDSPAFLRIQASMLRALGPYPDARAAVVNALRELDQEGAAPVNSAPLIEHAIT